MCHVVILDIRIMVAVALERLEQFVARLSSDFLQHHVKVFRSADGFRHILRMQILFFVLPGCLWFVVAVGLNQILDELALVGSMVSITVVYAVLGRLLGRLLILIGLGT